MPITSRTTPLRTCPKEANKQLRKGISCFYISLFPNLSLCGMVPYSVWFIIRKHHKNLNNKKPQPGSVCLFSSSVEDMWQFRAGRQMHPPPLRNRGRPGKLSATRSKRWSSLPSQSLTAYHRESFHNCLNKLCEQIIVKNSKQ